MAINYSEKGSGLHDTIRLAGYSIRQENGVWITSNDAAVQAIIDGYALADAKAAIGYVIEAYATRLRAKAGRDLSTAEMAGWAIKKAEADKFAVTGLASDAPNLALEANQRGVTLANLVTKVQANADVVNQREARIAGIAGKHKDAVKALASFEAVNAYIQNGVELLAGWPVV